MPGRPPRNIKAIANCIEEKADKEEISANTFTSYISRIRSDPQNNPFKQEAEYTIKLYRFCGFNSAEDVEHEYNDLGEHKIRSAMEAFGLLPQVQQNGYFTF